MKAELIHELVTVDVIATSSAYATRAHIVDLFNQLSAATARAEAAESTTVGLRRALEDAPDYIDHPMTGDAAQMLRRYVNTALAASPDEHERRIKAETLRETAKELESLRDHIQTEIGPDDARDDIRRVCLNRAKDLREEADRLEAANATTNT